MEWNLVIDSTALKIYRHINGKVHFDPIFEMNFIPNLISSLIEKNHFECFLFERGWYCLIVFVFFEALNLFY